MRCINNYSYTWKLNLYLFAAIALMGLFTIIFCMKLEYQKGIFRVWSYLSNDVMSEKNLNLRLVRGLDGQAFFIVLDLCLSKGVLCYYPGQWSVLLFYLSGSIVYFTLFVSERNLGWSKEIVAIFENTIFPDYLAIQCSKVATCQRFYRTKIVCLVWKIWTFEFSVLHTLQY